MTRDELDDEFRLLKGEHDALRAEHRVLERNPRDIPAHITHGERLHDHLSRLHKHMAGAWHAGAESHVPRRRYRR